MLFIFLFIPIIVLQGSGIIHGEVIDGTNQLPLYEANIIIVDSEIGTTTDENGKFTLENFEDGYYSIRVSYIGYETKILNDIWVRPNANDFQSIILYPSVIELNNVTVRENYFEKSGLSTYSSIGFKNDQIRRAPGAGSEITRVLNSLPSVASVGENRQDIMVRGGGPGENGFLIDNIYIPNISHFNQPDGRSNGPVGLINTDLVQNIEFFSNGFSSEYGNKLSSFGDISYKEGNNNSLEGNVGAGLGGAGGVIEGPLSSYITFLSSFRTSYLDLISDAINAGGLPSYNDFQGKINVKPNQYHNFTILMINGNSLYDRNKQDAYANNEDSYGKITNHQNTLGINHRYIWNKNAYSKNSISLSSQKSMIKFYNIRTDSVLNKISDRYVTSHFRNVNYVKFTKRVNTISGFEIHTRDLNYDFLLNDIFLDESVIFNNLSTFFNLNLKSKNRLSSSIGLRLEKSDFDKTINISPRVNIDLELPFKIGNVIINAGKYFQNPPEKYLGLVTQKKLKSVYAEQKSFSYEKLLNGNTKFSISVYEKKYGNAPEIYSDYTTDVSPAFLMDKNLTFVNVISTGKAQASGVEILFEKKRVQNLYGLVGGSLFNSTYVDYNGIERDRDSNYNYIFNIVGGYRPSSKWELSFRWSLYGGKPYTKIDTLNSTTYNTPIYFNENYNEERTPIYHNLFLRYEYRKVFKLYNFITYVELWNAYNRKNIETYTWSTSNNSILETTYFSLIPVGGFEVEF